MKKTLSILLAIMMILGNTLLLTGCSSPLMKPVAPYEASIEKSFICGSRDGDVLAININVKNTSNESIDDYDVLRDTMVELDGKSLSEAYLSSYDNPNAIDSGIKIGSGKEETVQAVFALDEDATGTITVTCTADSTDRKTELEIFTEEIKLDDIERIEYESDYDLSVDKATLTDDGEGNDIIVLEMTFTNNSSEAASLGSALSIELFQDGSSLKNSYLPYNHPAYDETMNDNSYADVKDGKSLQIQLVYQLNNTKSDVEFEAVDNQSFDQSKLLETTIKLSKDGASADDIVAETIDTASKFSFTVDNALVGYDDYSEVPIVVLVGTFTNNSDESISFSQALDLTATQGDYTLESTYLSGASTFNYNDIAPGATIPVYVGWELLDGENDITLKVVDSQHYAKEEIYNETYTIDQLIKNTEAFADEDGVIDKPLDA